MASLRKKAAGWQASVFVHGQRESRSFDTKAAAQAWAVQREAELRSLADGQGSKTHTVGDVLDRYQREVSPQKRGKRWEIYRLELIGSKEIDGRAFRAIRLADLKVQHITAWRDARLREVSGASVSREMCLLSHALKVARDEWGWLITDPMKPVRRPPDSRPRARRISEAEVAAITAALGYQEGLPVALPKQRVAVAFLFAIETAMRSGEILGLTSQAVDLTARVAHLPLTKNGGARDVPLSSRAVKLLQLLPAVEEGEPLFNLTNSSRDALYRVGRDRAAVGDVTFHDTRHEAITRLAKKIPVLDLARMTGHTNLNELMTYYNASAAEIARLLV